VLVDWDRYLAPVVTDVLPVSAHTVMAVVGVVEIAAGALVALRPRIGGYLVAAWLWAVIVNLLVLGDHFDVALRDFGLSLGALALARLAEAFGPTTFANDEGYDELVVARSIPFASLCRHHLLPFTGVAHVGYLPRDLQTRERLTAQVAGWLQERLAPRGVGVLVDAEHLCMTIRGVQAPGVRTVTSALRGRVRDDPRTRSEFLALATTVRG
jgi:hypothetical protein